jgi:hypothetical protein
MQMAASRLQAASNPPSIAGVIHVTADEGKRRKICGIVTRPGHCAVRDSAKQIRLPLHRAAMRGLANIGFPFKCLAVFYAALKLASPLPAC